MTTQIALLRLLPGIIELIEPDYFRLSPKTDVIEAEVNVRFRSSSGRTTSVGRCLLVTQPVWKREFLDRQARRGDAWLAQARIAPIKPPTPRMLITLFML